MLVPREKIYKNQDAPANKHAPDCALQPFLGYSMVDPPSSWIMPCDCGFDPRPYKIVSRGYGNYVEYSPTGTVEEGCWQLQSHKSGEYPPLICYGRDVEPGEYEKLGVSTYPIRPNNMKLKITGDVRLYGGMVYSGYKKKFLVEILEKYDE
jgi:hypothetical protein